MKPCPVPLTLNCLVMFSWVALAQINPVNRPSGSTQLHCGAAQVDISPPQFPVIVNAMFTERSADKVVDPLYAKALVLDDGSIRLALCVIDSCMVPRSLLDRAKQIVSESVDIPISRMLISATHTHSAPSAMGCLGSRVDSAYAAWLPGRIAEAILRSVTNLTPARVGWAVVDDWEHTFNRRWILRPDRLLTDPFGDPTVRAHMHPGHESPDALGPSGPVDPRLSLIALQSLEGRPLVLLANYSQHYYGSPLLSSDYYGRFAHHLTRLLEAEQQQPRLIAMMSQGTGGDLMWMDYGSPRREIGYDAYAREMAERVFQAYRRISWRNEAPLRMAERTLMLRYRVPDENRLAWADRTVKAMTNRLPQTLPEIYAGEAMQLQALQQTELKLQAVRIGELGVAAIPNEVFALTGLKIKAQSPLQPLINMSLANGAEGYIPPPEQHKLGGYTTWPARTAGLEVGAEPRIVATLLELLEEVAAKPRLPIVEAPGQYTHAVLASKPCAYWRLNEMVMPIAGDASGANRQATYEDGVALYLPGVGSGTGHLPQPQLFPSSFSGPQINRAVHFAGGRLRAGQLPLGSSYSLELWLWNVLPFDVRPVTGFFYSRGMEKDAAVRGEHLGIGGTQPSGKEGRLIFFNGQGHNPVLVGQRLLKLRQWHHLVFTREGGKVTVYVDGERDLTGDCEFALPGDQAAIFLGGRSDQFSNFEGKLDEVSFYPRVLSAEEIVSHYRASGVAEN